METNPFLFFIFLYFNSDNSNNTNTIFDNYQRYDIFALVPWNISLSVAVNYSNPQPKQDHDSLSQDVPSNVDKAPKLLYNDVAKMLNLTPHNI